MGKVQHMSHVEKRTLQNGKPSWTIMFRYTDWTGKRKQKKASGFSTKRDALAFERDFMERAAGSPCMTFGNLWEIFKKDYKRRVKESSFIVITANVRKRVLPYFQATPINQITPNMVRKWEHDLQDTGELSVVSLRKMHTCLSMVLNFARKYYHLPTNPAALAGIPMPDDPATHTLQFWTLDQFKRFDKAMQGDEPYQTLFRLLFWSGLRIGEARALMISDIDLENNIISVTKTYHRYGGRDVITPPKTAHSVRKVSIPSQLSATLQAFIKRLPHPDNKTRLFEHIKGDDTPRLHFYKGAERAGLPRIKIHDLRHSHASLLIQQNVPPIVIRDRLGHKSIQTTLDIYSHLYPTKGEELTGILSKLW